MACVLVRGRDGSMEEVVCLKNKENCVRVFFWLSIPLKLNTSLMSIWPDPDTQSSKYCESIWHGLSSTFPANENVTSWYENYRWKRQSIKRQWMCRHVPRMDGIQLTVTVQNLTISQRVQTLHFFWMPVNKTFQWKKSVAWDFAWKLKTTYRTLVLDCSDHLYAWLGLL